VNTDELEYALLEAERRVLEIQAKLHRWAGDDPHRRFDDLYNLVADPGFLLVAWDRVRNNKGARTAGVDGETAHYIESVRGLEGFLAELREDLKARTFRPLPARRRAIPKAGGKIRYLGIATDDSYCPSCNRVSGCSVMLRVCAGQGRIRGFAGVIMSGSADGYGGGLVPLGPVPWTGAAGGRVQVAGSGDASAAGGLDVAGPRDA
jgi:hypothetical protein